MRWNYWKRCRNECPHGHGSLAHGRVAGLPVGTCPACRGEWIQGGILQSFAPAIDNLVKSSARGPETAMPCPGCGEALRRHARSIGLPVAVEACPKGCGWWLDEGERQRLAPPPVHSRLRLKTRGIESHSHRLQMAQRYAAEARPKPPPNERELDVREGNLIVSPKDLDVPRRLLAWMGMPVESGLFFDARAWVTMMLIVANVSIFAWVVSVVGSDPASPIPWYFVFFGYVPADILNAYGRIPALLLADPGGRWHTMLTSSFLHGGIGHLFGNMAFLLLCGDDVERRIGSFRFLMFYLLGAVAAGLASIFLGGHPDIPSIGASGAISAVMGAYLVYCRGKRIYCWSFRFLFWGQLVGYPSALYLLFWFAMQFVMMRIPNLHIGFWAHIGGFGFGVFAAFLLTPFLKIEAR